MIQAALVAVAVRLLLTWTGIGAQLAWRPEVSTASNSALEVREGTALYALGVSPYAGTSVRIPPLALWLYSAVADQPWLSMLPNTVFDLVAATLLTQLAAKLFDKASSVPSVLAWVYLLNPFSLLASVAGTTSPLEGLAIVTALYGTCVRRPGLAVLGLAAAGYLSLHCLVLLLPVACLLSYSPEDVATPLAQLASGQASPKEAPAAVEAQAATKEEQPQTKGGKAKPPAAAAGAAAQPTAKAPEPTLAKQAAAAAEGAAASSPTAAAVEEAERSAPGDKKKKKKHGKGQGQASGLGAEDPAAPTSTPAAPGDPARPGPETEPSTSIGDATGSKPAAAADESGDADANGGEEKRPARYAPPLAVPEPGKDGLPHGDSPTGTPVAGTPTSSAYAATMGIHKLPSIRLRKPPDIDVTRLDGGLSDLGSLRSLEAPASAPPAMPPHPRGPPPRAGPPPPSRQPTRLTRPKPVRGRLPLLPWRALTRLGWMVAGAMLGLAVLSDLYLGALPAREGSSATCIASTLDALLFTPPWPRLLPTPPPVPPSPPHMRGHVASKPSGSGSASSLDVAALTKAITHASGVVITELESRLGALLYGGTAGGAAGGGGCWAVRVYGSQVLLDDVAPNVGQWWYLAMEAFDDTKPYIRLLAHSLLFALAPPLAMRLGPRRPLALFLVQLLALGLLRPYPSVADLGLAASLLPLLTRQQGALVVASRTEMLLPASLLVLCVLGPAMLRMWLSYESTNSNFFYSIVLSYGVWRVVLLMQVLGTTLRVDRIARGKEAAPEAEASA
ncbi:hypothetical protein HYH03_010221 [Edaphochlamys debaryana]|uniref:GPI transamidase subunit PIG-U n=1 Tax=Edaphochlamys debaryana TaxID=47281 RepID=A0A835Y2L7_9CHLO|nr:hypothetical protein HYH03_010221 [Edaphochlamys debaryana]|eukprot:KAG2491435.1 hypothetical protein HYH03_010221 [Edaphochlamys debaryana]